MQRISAIAPNPAPYGLSSELVPAAEVPAASARLRAARSEGTAADAAQEAPESPAPDVVVVPEALTEHGVGLAVCDVDSTFIEQEVIELIADHAGVRAQVAEITESAMRGELDFEASLRARVRTLAGLPVEVLAEVAQQVSMTPGAREFVRGVQAGGGRVALVSGGFDVIVEAIAADAGADAARANRLGVDAGRLTGEVVGAVIDRAAKADALAEYAQRWGVDRSQTIAVGDGANDIDMVEAAGMGFAFCAKPALVAAADAAISVRRLDAVLAAVTGERP
ncbi:phosphoserine phosphatase SerB [Brevibacterium sp. 5221]|uniref:phosphoserine phosphatase n=1 Tax=Brevibacterium rongguiense TaxID=2695267 RepID=A0A6N9H558_9MICO|nr:phosphoserine phosphatase SerB [Brevibacterium rongguiense]MYM18971.1 phosphoserine phosphatase SerB [Brevibacterium rongguiense]